MITLLKIFLGCKGTWFWACRQMQEGKTVRRLRDSGVVRFSYDHGRRRIKGMIEWETSIEPKEWGISMEDVFATDFELQYICKPLAEGPTKSQTIKPAQTGE
jgi:hypothetical protein